MVSTLINQLLTGKYQDPNSGQQLKIPIDMVLISDDICSNLGDLLRPVLLGSTVAIVSDNNTLPILGHTIERALTGIKQVMHIILPNTPIPDIHTVEHIRTASSTADTLIAVGSGTINDLCKYASFLDRKPYIIFGTAPSMNGYCSPTASIIQNHSKKSVTAQLPKAVFLDLNVMRAAPLRLAKSGLGDSICRSTCQADWLLSHLLLDSFYSDTPFEWLKPMEEELHIAAKHIPKRDPEAIKILCETLILSGMAMYICGGSYPASQGEHMIAHLMDSQYPHQSYHGEQIAVTTLTMAALQDMVISTNLILSNKIVNPYAINQYLHNNGYDNDEAAAKILTPEQIDALQDKLNKIWPDAKTKLNQIIIPQDKLRQILISADLACSYHNLGWHREHYRDAVRYAAYTRNRFTFLDLAIYSGLLESYLPFLVS